MCGNVHLKLKHYYTQTLKNNILTIKLAMQTLTFRMPPRVPNDSREFTPAEKMFVCNLKIAGEKYPSISNQFTQKFGKLPPSRTGVFGLVKKLKDKFTVLDLRKGR